VELNGIQKANPVEAVVVPAVLLQLVRVTPHQLVHHKVIMEETALLQVEIEAVVAAAVLPESAAA
jgi:hypothetical protein